MSYTYKELECSKGEIIKRLVDGEVFYIEINVGFPLGIVMGCLEYKNEEFISSWAGHQQSIDVNNELSSINVFEKVETPWYENIPEGGVLCWVHCDYARTDQAKRGDYIDTITNYCNNGFESSNDTWLSAIPIKREELDGLFLEELKKKYDA